MSNDNWRGEGLPRRRTFRRAQSSCLAEAGSRKAAQHHRVGALAPFLTVRMVPENVPSRDPARATARHFVNVSRENLNERREALRPFGVAEPPITSHQSLLTLFQRPGTSSYPAGTPRTSPDAYASIPYELLPRLVSCPFHLRSICTSGFPL